MPWDSCPFNGLNRANFRGAQVKACQARAGMALLNERATLNNQWMPSPMARGGFRMASPHSGRIASKRFARIDQRAPHVRGRAAVIAQSFFRLAKMTADDVCKWFDRPRLVLVETVVVEQRDVA